DAGGGCRVDEGRAVTDRDVRILIGRMREEQDVASLHALLDLGAAVGIDPGEPCTAAHEPHGHRMGEVASHRDHVVAVGEQPECDGGALHPGRICDEYLQVSHDPSLVPISIAHEAAAIRPLVRTAVCPPG